MFYPNRIVGIKNGDRVLEVGPGGGPHQRSDVLLEIDPRCFKNKQEEGYQRGNAPTLRTDKKLVYYDGGKFPFKDSEFDYVICSHVLEHVRDPELFVSEVSRVANKGYMEFPSIFYEYLYDIPVHVNICHFDGDVIKYIRKEETPFSEFAAVQKFFLETLEAGYTDIVDDLLEFMGVGFEWKDGLEIRHVKRIVDVVPSKNLLRHKPTIDPLQSVTSRQLFRALASRTARKILWRGRI